MGTGISAKREKLPEVAATKSVINLIVGWLEGKAGVRVMWMLRFCLGRFLVQGQKR